MRQLRAVDGMSIAAIAQHVGVSHGTASAVLRGVAAPAKVHEADIARMRELRAQHQSFKQIAEITGFGIVTVKNHCSAVEVSGYKGRELPEAIKNRIKSMRAESTPLLTIAETLGVGWSTVNIHAKGVVPKVRGRGQRLSDAMVQSIYDLTRSNFSPADIAARLGISLQSVTKFQKIKSEK